VEDEVLREQIEQYNETVSRYQQYHQQQQQHHLDVGQHHGHPADELMDVELERRRHAHSDVVQVTIPADPTSGVAVAWAGGQSPGPRVQRLPVLGKNTFNDNFPVSVKIRTP